MEATRLFYYMLLYYELGGAITKHVNNENEVIVPARKRCSTRNIRDLNDEFKLLICGICPKGKEQHINRYTGSITHCRPCRSGYYNDGTKTRCKKCKRCQEPNNVSSRYLTCTKQYDTVCHDDVNVKSLEKQKENIIKHGIRHARHRERKFLRNLEIGITCQYGESCGNFKPQTTEPFTSATTHFATRSRVEIAVSPGLEKPIDLEEDEPPPNETKRLPTIVGLTIGVLMFVLIIFTLAIFAKKAWNKQKYDNNYLPVNLETSCELTQYVNLGKEKENMNVCTHSFSYDASNEKPLPRKNSTSSMNCFRADIQIPLGNRSSFLSNRSSVLSNQSCSLSILSKQSYLIFPANRSSFSSNESFTDLLSCTDMTLLNDENSNSVKSIGDNGTNFSENTTEVIGTLFHSTGIFDPNYLKHYYEFLNKSTECDTQNIFTNYYQDTTTQTPVNLVPQNIFNGQWDMYGTFNTDGGRLLKESSSIELIIPRGVVAKGDNVEIYGAVFTDLALMRDAFNLDQYTWMTSAAVEYYKPGGSSFQKDVIIRLQHCLTSGFNPSFFEVLWFMKNDEGCIVTEEVLLKEVCGNGGDGTWFEFGPDNTVLIHTHHFSGFFCTYCNHDIPVSLTAEIFGSHELIDYERHEVKVDLYLWDTKCFIKDFKEYTSKKTQDMTLFAKQEVLLQEDTNRDSMLVCTLQPSGDYADRWHHILRPGGNRPIFKKKQTRKLHEIVKCCRESGPQLIQWTLKGSHTTFQGIVDINHIVGEDNDESENEDYQTTVYISNLTMSSSYKRVERVGNSDRFQKIGRVLAEELTVSQTEDLARLFKIEHNSCNRPIGHNPDSLSTKYSIVIKCMEHNPDEFWCNLCCNLDKIGSSSLHKMLVEQNLLPDFAFPEMPVKQDQATSYKRPIQETGEADAYAPSDQECNEYTADDTQLKEFETNENFHETRV